MSKKNTEDKLYVNKAKMIYKWPSAYHTYRKAWKINKKNKKETDSYNEQFRYEWLKKRVDKAMPLFDVEIQVHGLENWLDKGIVLVPNHQSNFDVMALIAINDFEKHQPLAFIAKKELWDSKKTSRFVNLIDVVPLDRKSPRSAIAAFKEGKDLIVDFKRSMVVFPEGTRSDSQEMLEFQPGALKLPQMANAPIVPVSFIDSYKVFKDKKDREKTVIVKVVFGKPILPAKHLSMSTTDLAALVKKEIQKNIDIYKDKELTPLSEIRNPEKAAKKAEKEKSKGKKKSSIFKIVE